LANVIIGASDFWFIDWESVSTGIKEWDIAGLLQSCIAEVVIEGPLSPWVIESSSQLKAVLQNGDDLLLDCVASRLMQSAVELSQGAQSIPSWAVDLLQAADDIVRRRFEGLWNLLS
jgi:thiamine kinase-like enzyme